MSAREKTARTAKIPEETSRKLRDLSHDLSNSIETILQASYLLAQLKLEGDVKKWSDLVDKAARDCARINREIRDALRGKPAD
jgi:signal transduction histidine kinase